jgi:pectate lyase
MKKLFIINLVILLFLSCAFGTNNVYQAESYSSGGILVAPDLSDKELTITPADIPTGWASYKGKYDLTGAIVSPPESPGGYGGKVVTVNNRSDLLSALNAGEARVIFIDGFIDMTEGILPAKAKETSSGLNNFIANYTNEAVSMYNLNPYFAVSTYEEWKKLYASKINYASNPSGDIVVLQKYLANKWKNIIQLPVKSNTTIIGVSEGSGIKGCSFQINSVQNVIIRNLTLQDAYDPFPVFEANDGLNANYDLINIQQSKYIWIDHCTLEDTLAVSDEDLDIVTTSDGIKTKWQVYDGLCDITKTNDFITVSWCEFKNHDKTMLIGNSDTYTADHLHQTITLHHNYFLNCRQRLPMVRFATLHIYNNYFVMDSSSGRINSYAIGVRKDSRIVSEHNYFGKGITYAFKDSYGTVSSLHDMLVEGVSIASILSTSESWSPQKYYNYTYHEAQVIPNIVIHFAGANKMFTLMT